MPIDQPLNNGVSRTLHTRNHRWMLGICTALAFLVNLQLPHGVANSTLDSSWPQVLAHALLQHVQWGTQLSFTYGPLGFVTPYMGYVAGMFWPYVIAQWIVAILFATVAWYALRRQALYQLALFAASLITFGSWVAGDAAWLSAYALSIVALAQLLPSKKKSAWLMVDVVLISALPALLPLVKVTLLAPWLVWLAAGIAICLLGRQRRLALWLLFTGIAFPLLGWYACGQEFSHLGKFLHESLEIATGYSEAMQTADSSPAVDLLGLLATCLSTVIIVLYLVRQRETKSWFVAAVFFGVLACAFKLGFTRADSSHLPIFVAASLIIISSLPLPEYAGQPLSTSNRKASIKLSLANISTLVILTIFSFRGSLAWRTLDSSLTGHKIAASLQFIFMPRETINDYEKQATSFLSAADLPQIREYVKKEPVDVMSYEQGVAYANNFNLVFRPIFQSYSAYTLELIERNDAFYRSASSPKWLIFKLQTIDHRLPSEDDALLFSRIATSYTPVIAEKNYLLLKHDPGANQNCLEQHVMSTTTTMGNWLDLKAAGPGTLNVRIDFGLSLLGRLKALALRTPVAAIEVQRDDGKTVRYRLLHAAAETGFMVSPLLDNTQEYLDWRMGNPMHRATALRVMPWKPGNAGEFSSHVSFSVEHLKCGHT